METCHNANNCDKFWWSAHMHRQACLHFGRERIGT